MSMLKKTITYTDYDGAERTEDFYFNLKPSEIAELELGTAGGLAEKLRRIVAANEKHKIIEYFKEILLLTYGEKSDDGKYFRKSPEISKAFSDTEAYSMLFMELATDANAASEFINAVLPKQDPKGGGFIPAKTTAPAHNTTNQ